MMKKLLILTLVQILEILYQVISVKGQCTFVSTMSGNMTLSYQVSTIKEMIVVSGGDSDYLDVTGSNCARSTDCLGFRFANGTEVNTNKDTDCFFVHEGGGKGPVP